MKKNNDGRESTIAYVKTAVPVAAALVLFLVSAGFIAYKMISNRLYNERWKDYDECGLS